MSNSSEDYSDSSSEASEASSDDEQEDALHYCKGGYHLVKPGDFFNERYLVVRKLGWGHFSTVWLSWDAKNANFVALKVMKSARSYTETAVDEIKLLKCTRDTDPSHPFLSRTVQLLDDFKITGSNGKHICMVFEVLGQNLLKLIIDSKYRGINLNLVKSIIRQTLQGMQYLHNNCKIIHTDIKPENILVCVSQEQVRKLAWEVLERKKMGLSPLPGTVANLVKGKSKTMSKNKLKKLRRKAKKNQEVLKAKMDSLDIEDKKSQSPEGHSSSVDAVCDENSKRLNSLFEAMEKNQMLNRETPNPQVELGVAKFTRDEINVKIADLGNACWVHHHFSEDIQTRQYRSPEVIIGSGYGTSSDIWSIACLAFELATGEYLFDPHSGHNYDRDEDHLAHMIELLGPMPKGLIMRGKHSRDFFTKAGRLRRIKNLKEWKLYDILVEKYKWSENDAEEFTSFLTPMLEFHPDKRATAEDCLGHHFLKEIK